METSRAVTGEVGDKTILRVWGWIGHMLKRPDRYIAKRATECNPQGECERGRPQHAWRCTRMEELEKRQLMCQEVKCTAQNRVRSNTPVDNLCSIRNEEDE